MLIMWRWRLWHFPTVTLITFIMSQKRKLQPEPDLDLEPMFEKLISLANNTHWHHNKSKIIEFLKAAKLQLESTSAPSTKIHKPANSFTPDDAVSSFRLIYQDASPLYYWTIELDVKEMQPSHCLCIGVFLLISFDPYWQGILSLSASFLDIYTKIYVRSSEKACRLGLDLIINRTCESLSFSFFIIKKKFFIKRVFRKPEIRVPIPLLKTFYQSGQPPQNL